MRAPRLDNDRVDDQARDDRPIRVRPDYVVGHQLLDDDDHAIGRECGLLLAAEQAPDLGVARGGSALRVNDGHVRPKRRHGIHDPVAVRGGNLAD